ncbi:MAG: imidazoleglycerol-phosphate dehydratase HisB [bacterium]
MNKNKIERKASIIRETKETKIKVEINLDGKGESSVKTGIGFFNHMINQLCLFSRMDIKLEINGDLDVCDHHTIEDAGIVIGKCIKSALGNKAGISRYGNSIVPMDESLCMCIIDVCNRPFFSMDTEFVRENINGFSTENVSEFFNALALNLGINLWFRMLEGKNDHHKIEAMFKSFGVALRNAIVRDLIFDSKEVLSTKGVL